MTLAELELMMPRLLAQARAERHRRGVRFVRARRVIDVAGSALDLDRAATAAGLLDSLLQIGLRTEPQRLRDVIDELDDACRTVFGTGVQGVYCPWGEARVVDWRRGVTRPARADADASSRTGRGRKGVNRTPTRGAPRSRMTARSEAR